MTPEEAFFTVHRDLPREGPGEADDVIWALEVAGTPERARICDAACGPGADTVTLAEARPEARIDAVDITPHFVAAARDRVARFGRRVQVYERDYSDLPGDYDLIWCAGAMYFHGYLNVLEMWRHRLLPGGRIAFSEPVWVSDPPAPEAVAFWREEGHLESLPATVRRLGGAGWRILGQRWLIGAPWEAYYGPLRERLDRLSAEDPGEDVAQAIDAARQEIANWEAAPDQIAYSLFVVGPA